MNFKDEPGQSQLALHQLGWKILEERRKHIIMEGDCGQNCKIPCAVLCLISYVNEV